MQCSINIDYILLVDGVVGSSISLLIFYLVVPTVVERSVEASNYNCKFVHFSIIFASHVLQLCCLVYIHMKCLFPLMLLK